MRILVVGGGGREHALVWRLARDSERHILFAAPGNPGIARHATCFAVAATDIDGQVALARREHIDLVVIGPEAPLCAGLADALNAAEIDVFGPSAAAARLEGSKAFAKEFLARQRIATAPFGVFEEVGAALDYVRRATGPFVVKADGLAAGKGVVVCDDEASASAAIRAMLGERRFGQASARVVVEQRLRGREASLMALVSGERVVALPAAEDHKAAHDGDIGPMTGGMGVVSPTPVVDDALVRRILAEVLEPAAKGCVAEGFPYRGVLYAGLMITSEGPRVLEFNCRWGDPEAEAILPRLGGDLAATLRRVAGGEAVEPLPTPRPAAACVVIAAEGYPGAPRTGDRIEGLEAIDSMADVVAFHAGTRRAPDGSLVTAGGRVLAVTATGESPEDARTRAYRAVGHVRFDGAWYRRDIGVRGPWNPPSGGNSG